MDNQFEPKTASRYIVKFPERFNISEYVIKEVSNIQCIIGQHGEIEWQDIRFDLYDPICPSTSQAMHYLLDHNDNNKPMKVVIDILDPIGEIIEKKEIIGYIQMIDFGALNYSINEPRIISIYLNVESVKLDF